MRMHTFLQITQAVFNQYYKDRPEIHYLDGSAERYYEFYQEQSTKESQLPYSQRRGVEKLFFMMYISENNVTPKTKFAFLNRVFENMFMNDESREKFLCYFTKIQRAYHVLSKFGYTCRHKRAPVLIAKDVYLNPLSETQDRVFAFVQNRQKYLFTLTDLINILNTSLGNTFFFVSEPLPCRNPYTNLPFNKSTLYNIYFYIKRTEFVMPQMFHKYFVSNFNLKVYAEDNEDMIREYSIKQYINNAEYEELYYEIRSMLTSEKYGKKIKIHDEFPKDILVNVMKPYLELFYKGTYTLNESKRDKYEEEYQFKIKRFYEYNKLFGRRHFKRVYPQTNKLEERHKYTPIFNDKHVGFNEPDVDDFLTSHISINE